MYRENVSGSGCPATGFIEDSSVQYIQVRLPFHQCRLIFRKRGNDRSRINRTGRHVLCCKYHPAAIVQDVRSPYPVAEVIQGKRIGTQHHSLQGRILSATDIGVMEDGFERRRKHRRRIGGRRSAQRQAADRQLLIYKEETGGPEFAGRQRGASRARGTP